MFSSCVFTECMSGKKQENSSELGALETVQVYVKGIVVGMEIKGWIQKSAEKELQCLEINSVPG